MSVLEIGASLEVHVGGLRGGHLRMSTHALYARGKSELGIVSKLNSAADAGVCFSISWARICKCFLLDESDFSTVLL